jgi:hypothetical protein
MSMWSTVEYGAGRVLILLALLLLVACDQGSAPKAAPAEDARPVATALTGEAADCPPPRGWDIVGNDYEDGSGRVRNIIVLSKADELLWNGAKIDLEQLGQYLELTTQMEPAPILELRPDPRASCELMSRVVAATVVADLDCAALCRFELTPADDIPSR